MHRRFVELIEALEPKYRALMGKPPVKYRDLPRKLPSRAIYLLSEPSEHLYVGRTNRLRERLRGHCIPSASHFTATLAFRIARRETGKLKATYRKSGSRAELLKDPEFLGAFEDAKRRISSMDIRFVEETDPTRQALLEIYVASVLTTPYNDFDNH